MAEPISLVNDLTPRSQFTANGTQRAFFCEWPIRAQSDLRVYFDADETPDIAFTVVGANNDAGFTVTFTTAPPDGTLVTILRAMPLERQTNYGPQKQFNASTVNAEQSDFVMLLQQLRMLLERTIRLADSDPVTSLVLPPVADRANRYAYFNEAGELTALGATIEAVLDFAQYPADTPLITDTFAFNRVGAETDIVRRATLAHLETVLFANRHKSFYSAADAGMVGDGVTDDSFAFHSHMAATSAAGGGTYTLKSQVSGGSFYLSSAPRIPSNVSVIMLSPFLCASGVWPRIEGALVPVSGGAGFTLQIDATAGGATLKIDTAPLGGGAVSAYWAVDDYGQVIGLRDGCGTAREYQEFRVTAVSDGAATITLHNTASHSYESTYDAGAYETNYGAANRTVVNKLVTALLTADLTEGSNLVTIRSGDIGRLVAGDMVTIISERTSADVVPGSTSVLIDQEQAVIVSSVSGDASNTLRLNRRVERTYATAYKSRLIKVAPVTGASLSGARMLFAAAPDLVGTQTPALEMLLARNCILSQCSVPNTDAYGTRGPAFEVDRSMDCGIDQCTAANAKYVDSGDGYGVALRRSTGCWVRGGLFDAMRHGFVGQTVTNCFAVDAQFHNPRMAPVDCHGQNERGMVFYNCTLDAGAQSATVDGVAPTAIAFGNTTWLAGSHKCGFVGGRVSGFKSGSGSADKTVLQFAPVSTGCFVRGTEFVNIGILWKHDDIAGFGSIVSSGHRIEHCSIDGCSSPQLFDLHGRRNGGSVNSLADIKIRNNTARNLNGGVLTRYVDELEIEGNSWDEVTVDAAYTYVIRAEDCPGLEIDGNRFKSFGRGVSLLNCTGRAIGNHFLDQITGGTVLLDNGGCDGFEWLANHHSGFSSSMTRTGASLIVEWPRLAGGITLTDDTAIKLKPRFPSGRYRIYSTIGTAFRATFDFTISTSDIDPLSSSAIVNFTTGALAGTTGTDGKITISVNSSLSTIEIENRTGADLRIDGSHE